MKKLILAMVVAISAIAVNAASIKWNSGTVYNYAGTKANAGTAAVTAYLYSITEAEYTSLSSKTAAEIYQVAGSSVGTLVTSQKTSALGAANITQNVTGGTSESPVTYYGVVLYVDSISDSSVPYVKAALQSVTFQDDGVSTLGNLATNAGSWTSSAVPEPTSGLLMLLGMAGLALRRKRA